MNAEEQIAAILAKYGEAFTGNVRYVQDTAVLDHKALERIGARAGITFDPPTVLRAERDEAVLLVVGHMGERSEWSIGEALLDVNYRVSGRQSAYVYATAEERAKDRVALKLVGLHGIVYSDREADEFETALDMADGKLGTERPSSRENEPAARSGMEPRVAELRRKFEEAQTVEAVTDLMTRAETQQILAELPPRLRDQVREDAKARMVALGWTKRAA